MIKIIQTIALTLCVIMTVSTSVSAIETNIDGLDINGRIKAGFSRLYDLDGDGGTEAGPANYLGELNLSYRPNRNFTLIGNFWLRGDMQEQDFTDEGKGLRNAAAGPPFLGGSFTHGTNNCNRSAGAFCADDDELKLFNDFDDEVIREFSLKYRDPKRRYTVKIGKFQRGWGQSDGLRLLDILHAQDLRERFVFKDADEIRIPAWMISADFNLKKMGVAGMFEGLGMHKPVLEINIVPEVRHSEFIINNPTTSKATSGGAFGFQWPNFVDTGLPHQSNFGAVSFGAKLTDRGMKDFDLSRPEISARLKFQTLGGTMTFNGFLGRQDLPILKMRGGTVHVGSGNNDPVEALANGGANVDVDHQTMLAALWAPAGALGPTAGATAGLLTGGYLPYLRANGTGVGGGIGGLESPLTTLTGGACADPFNPGNGGPLACSVSVDMDLDYTYMQKTIGMSFARDLSDFMSFGPKDTSPSIRAEIAYEFDKPFNRSVVENPFIPGLFESGAVANFVSPSVSVVKTDVISLMIGFDYPLWVPGWDTQQKSIFTSYQFFNIHTRDAHHLMAQAPYGNTEVETNQQYQTFLWSAPLDNQRLVLEGLLIHNIDSGGISYRQRIDFNYFGPKWRPRFELQHFSGPQETAPIGLFDDKDFFEFSLTYQF